MYYEFVNLETGLAIRNFALNLYAMAVNEYARRTYQQDWITNQQQNYNERITERNKADVMEASVQKSLGSSEHLPPPLPRPAPIDSLLSYKRRATSDTCLSNAKTATIAQPKLSMRANIREHLTSVARKKCFWFSERTSFTVMGIYHTFLYNFISLFIYSFFIYKLYNAARNSVCSISVW